MGAETVIKKIEEKALAECEAIRASYAAKAEQIKNNILAEAESKARSIVDNENEKARLMMMRGKQQSTLEKRIRTLDHRHALISGIKAETLAKLKNADAASKIALYTKYVENSGIPLRKRIEKRRCLCFKHRNRRRRDTVRREIRHRSFDRLDSGRSFCK